MKYYLFIVNLVILMVQLKPETSCVHFFLLFTERAEKITLCTLQCNQHQSNSPAVTMTLRSCDVVVLDYIILEDFSIIFALYIEMEWTKY